MLDYQFVLIHKPGSQNSKADFLSRQADHDRGVEDNLNVTLLKPEFFRNLQIQGLNQEILNQIRDKPITEKRNPVKGKQMVN